MNFNDSTLTRWGNKNRKGLAPFEMTMVLPLLMMIMAMFMVFGYAATWKARSEGMARDAVWRDRMPRFSNRNAEPQEWPAPASQSHRLEGNLQDMDGEEVVYHPLITGPIPQIDVNDQRLFPGRGVWRGVANVDRAPPVFPTLSRINFNKTHSILDDRFTHRDMGIGNMSRRVRLIWETGLDELLVSAEIAAATAAITGAPYLGQIRNAGLHFPSFPGSRCQSPDEAARNSERLIERISRVPVTMASRLIALYRYQLSQNPPEPLKSELERKIAELQRWLDEISS